MENMNYFWIKSDCPPDTFLFSYSILFLVEVVPLANASMTNISWALNSTTFGAVQANSSNFEGLNNTSLRAANISRDRNQSLWQITLIPTDMRTDPLYSIYFNWFRFIAIGVVPFALLVLFNAKIYADIQVGSA